jgi:acetyltransferase-like isoleucine patch superfamily enzyme
MIYGYVDKHTNLFRKYTRMSDTVVIMSPEKLSIGDNVWVWHYSILDATEGITIGTGCQIGAWVGIFTHGSQNAIRLYGSRYVDFPSSERKGYTRGAVTIGAYTFIGAGAMVFPGVNIGKGCIIAAGTIVTKDIPDYVIVQGIPGKITGDTHQLDQQLLEKNPDLNDLYFESNGGV